MLDRVPLVRLQGRTAALPIQKHGAQGVLVVWSSLTTLTFDFCPFMIAPQRINV